jgi:AcrR family transcriptional regulator
VPLGFPLSSAARSLYASEGSAGFTIRRLAKRVGASSAALYSTWPSREALLDHVAWQAWESFRSDLGRHDGLKPQRARLAALTADAIDFALANPHLWDLMLEPKKARSRHAERALNLVSDMILQAHREETLNHPSPSQRAGQAWLALLAGMVRLYRIGTFPEDVLRQFSAEFAGKIIGLA